MIGSLRGLFSRYLLRSWRLVLPLLVLAACQAEQQAIKSVVLTGGAYVRIGNRQILGQPVDTTSLAALNGDTLSLEIWAAGDTLPPGSESPALFMIGNAQGEDELGIYRLPSDSSQIFIFLGNQFMGFYSIPGCNWNDPDIFTQVVLTYDGATLSIYGNGQPLAPTDVTINLDVTIDLDVADSDALIGADWDGPNLGNFWQGAIDEVRLWTKVLPASEMLFRYQNPDKLTRNYSPTGLDRLIGLWRFNRAGGDGDLVPDGSGKGNDATYQAGAGQLDFTDAGA